MRSVHIWTYNENSEGAKALGQHTGWKRIKHKGSTYKASKDRVIINWGDSKNFPIGFRQSEVLNSPDVVGAVSNKLKFFELIDDECRTVPWTTDKAQVLEWLRDNPKNQVVCRMSLTGHSGHGIILYSGKGEQALPNAPLYTLYVPKKDEYRVHFFKGEIIDVQQKRKRKDFEGEANFQIRNHDNGFVYCRGDVVVPEDVTTQALAVVKACGLDFGAIDIIYNEHQQKAYVLEVNTAPGLEGQSVDVYAEAIKRYVV